MSAEYRLAHAFLGSHPREAASVLERADAGAASAVLQGAKSAVITAALRHMTTAEGAEVLSRLPPERASRVLSELPLGLAAAMLRTLESPERSRLMDAASEETTRALRAALDLPEGSAGSMMDANCLALPSTISVSEARRRVERRSRHTGNYVYIVDEQHRLVGAVTVSELIVAPSSAGLASLLPSSVLRVSAQAGTDAVLEHPGWRELHAVPVVDSDGVLIGVLRRQIYERLRDERAERSEQHGGGVSMALAELAWTALVSTADEVAGAMRPANSAPAGGKDGR